VKKQNGTLRIKVSTNEGTIPVSDANVQISDAIGRVVHTLTTDTNGATMIVNLFAPSREFSMSPYTSHLAHSLYEVMVTHPSFITQIVRGVRVFDGEGSLLPIDLVARDARIDLGDSVNIFELPPPRASEPMNYPPPGVSWNR